MNPKLLIMSLLSLACTINGQDTDSTNPIGNVPKPSNQLTLDDLPSPQELEAGMAAALAPVKSTQDIQAAIQNQMEVELARNNLENEARAARINFPPPQGARTNQQQPRPTDMGAFTARSSGTQADGQISVGNIQVVYNDELRTIMRDYNITPEEIKQMLELYAKGGTATITKERTNPATGLQEIVTLDFENFTSQRPGASITSISPTAGALPVGVSSGPVSTSPPVDDPLQDFLSAEAYLREQIKELDAQFDALNAAYQQGTITRQTRNENAMTNRDERKKFETDLRAIQMEIRRRTGGEKPDIRVPRINRGDDGEFFGNGPKGPQPFKIGTNEVTPETIPSTNDILELAQQNEILAERLRRLRQGGGSVRSGPGFERSRFDIQGGRSFPRGQPPRPDRQLPGQLPRNMTPQQRALLRRELANIRRREQLIFQRLSHLRNRNPQLLLRGNRFPAGRNAFQQQLRRRISFANGNRPLLTRTLRGSVTGQDVLRRRLV